MSVAAPREATVINKPKHLRKILKQFLLLYFPQRQHLQAGAVNYETAVSQLKELNQYGSVRNLNDRRTDLYELLWKKNNLDIKL